MKQADALRPTAVDYFWRYLTVCQCVCTEPVMVPPLHLVLGTRENVGQQYIHRRFLFDLPRGSVLAKLDSRNAFDSPAASTCWKWLRISSMIYIYLVYAMQSVLMYRNFCLFSNGLLFFCLSLQPSLSYVLFALFSLYLDDLTLGGKTSVATRDAELTRHGFEPRCKI